jgi:hypothetical protein
MAKKAFQLQLLEVCAEKAPDGNLSVSRGEAFEGEFPTQEAAESCLRSRGYLPDPKREGDWQTEPKPAVVRPGYKLLCNAKMARVVYQEVYISPVFNPFPF